MTTRWNSSARKVGLVGSLFVAVPLCLAADASGDILWYSLDSDSQVDLVHGGVSPLSGQMALRGCGATGARAQQPDRDYYNYAIHALELERAPRELALREEDSEVIPVFDGLAVSRSLHQGAMRVRFDGRVRSFEWLLRHRLNHEGGDEAWVDHRDLSLDPDQESWLIFGDSDDACPEGIELHLLLRDATTAYRREERESASGEWVAGVRATDQTSEMIGRVTLSATRIPGSEEPEQDAARPRRQVRPAGPVSVPVRRAEPRERLSAGALQPEGPAIPMGSRPRKLEGGVMPQRLIPQPHPSQREENE